MKSRGESGRRLKLGIVANEFFDLRLGRMGGFGWAAREVARCFQDEPSLGVEVVFLTNAFAVGNGEPETFVHRTRLVSFRGGRVENLRRLRAEKFDLVLSIDYRPNYGFFYRALPRTPLVVWVRDPRPPEDVAEVNTLRLPCAGARAPEGIAPIDCTSLAQVARASRLLARPLLFATPAPHLLEKCRATYGVEPSEMHFLPNIIELNPVVPKSVRPRVVFLGRLDPCKRPWLFTKLAEHFPSVEFICLGQSHFADGETWKAEATPPNVRFLGHLDGAEKQRLLASAWVLVNTSIHEGLAVSFLEALACETALLSCQNPGEVVSRFGVYTGALTGAGLDGIPLFVEGLKRLLEDGERRARLGREGRKWVHETHSRTRFLRAFQDLCARAGVRHGGWPELSGDEK